MTTTQNQNQTAWCPEHQSRQTIEETADNGHMTRAGEVTYLTTYLACGHTLQGPEQVTAPAPGAPYAPGAYATLRDSRTWGALAQAAQRATDPWAVEYDAMDAAR